MAVQWNTSPEPDSADPRAACEALCAEKAALAEKIAAYREEHGVKDIPNTMEYERVTLDARLVRAQQALENAIATGAAAATVAPDVEDEPPAVPAEPSEPAS